MKKTLVAIAVSCALPAITYSSPAAKITFHVADDEGKAITNSTVVLFSYDRSLLERSIGSPIRQNKDRVQTKGLTDTNGCVTLTISSEFGDLYYRVDPFDGILTGGLPLVLGDGRRYYIDWGSKIEMKSPVDDKWQPWNPTVELVERPILNPIPMYARMTGSKHPPLKLPEFGKPIGFDLIKSDWVTPYGKGQTADFIFCMKVTDSAIPKEYYVDFPRAPQWKDMDARLMFANEGDGLQSVIDNPTSGGSIFRLPRYAPESGYESNLVRGCSAVYVRRSIELRGEYEGNPNQNYIFRVRSQRDRNGAITNALYGKIRGPISFYPGGGGISFTYYLNPTPNDHNLEYDFKRNLLTGKISELEFPSGP